MVGFGIESRRSGVDVCWAWVSGLPVQFRKAAFPVFRVSVRVWVHWPSLQLWRLYWNVGGTGLCSGFRPVRLHARGFWRAEPDAVTVHGLPFIRC